MDIEPFVRKAGSRLHQYRLLYNGLDTILAALILFAAAIVFDIGAFFRLIGPIEPYVGLVLNIGAFAVSYETLGLLLLCIAAAVLIVKLIPRIRPVFSGKAIVRFFKKAIGERKIEIKRSSEKPVKTGGTRKTDWPSQAVSLIETKNPALKDRLRTAYDNVRNDDIVSQDLVAHVSEEIESVPLSCMMNKKKIRIDILAIIVIFAAVLFFWAASIEPLVDTDRIVSDFRYNVSGDELSHVTPDGDAPSTDTAGSVITGPPTISQSKGTEIDVSLPPGSGIGPGSQLDAENAAEIFGPSTDYDPTSIAAGHYTDALPEGYETLVKQYFEKMAENS